MKLAEFAKRQNRRERGVVILLVKWKAPTKSRCAPAQIDGKAAMHRNNLGIFGKLWIC